MSMFQNQWLVSLLRIETLYAGHSDRPSMTDELIPRWGLFKPFFPTAGSECGARRI